MDVYFLCLDNKKANWVYININCLRQLPRNNRMASTQTTTNCPGLPINIAALIAAQEQSNPRNLVSNSASSQRVELADFLLSASLTSPIVHGFCHSRFDNTGTEGVDSDARAG